MHFFFQDSFPTVHDAGEVPKIDLCGFPGGPDVIPFRDRLGGRCFHARKDGLICLRLGSGDFCGFRFLDQFVFDFLRFFRRDQGDS